MKQTESLRAFLVGSVWSTEGGTGLRPNLSLSLIHWVNRPGHSMVYFLCIFLCLLSLYGVISVRFLASFFQAVWPIPYLNCPLPIMKVSVLVEWIRKDHHRDNFSSEDDSDMQEAISVDILCSHTVGISVLKGSLLLLIHLRTCKRLRGLSVGGFSPLHLKSNPFLFQIKGYGSEWFDYLILQSSWCPQRFQTFWFQQ